MPIFLAAPLTLMNQMPHTPVHGRKIMKHFSTNDWIDFVRQVVSNSQKIEMQQHLDDGCSKCLENANTWRRVMEVAKVQNTFEPPTWAKEAVDASFSLRNVVSFPTGKLELASLLFDSATQPIAVGMRGSSPAVRQLLYRSGSVCIDMRMQPKLGSDSVVLMGQLLDSAKPDHGVGGIPVSLLCEGDTVSRAKTNDVGEFDFGITALDHLQLVFGIGGSRTIVVPVPDGESARDLS